MTSNLNTITNMFTKSKSLKMTIDNADQHCFTQENLHLQTFWSYFVISFQDFNSICLNSHNMRIYLLLVTQPLV